MNVPSDHLYIASADFSKHSIELPIKFVSREIQTTALLDSGAFSCYIDQRCAQKYEFKMISLNCEIRILNTDASPNKGGTITHRSLLITNLGHMSMILGMKFLQEHNPRVD
ncbi:uncharacterized protein LAESUDRAFT_663169 [Laetiporus sulphureus 93-53]|uniref:Aspartic peptidase DDI1-type domain-containing protein n=1 Tax=Laetiporus sulphureus 93-53 TaxID=1314785 RepID=A0A165BXF7_9APHY|nr:uncharacterized protein LAESUDRAFT_663169 [Laetiporus sulphureus 93-53]KZT01829.1 hypothetical protein LAESUDRAFT_663169 [Laetiporus sulphureus 93-53]